MCRFIRYKASKLQNNQKEIHFVIFYMLLNNFDICFDFMILSVKANKRPILSSLYVEHMVTGQRVYIVGMLYVDPMESSIGP